MAKTKPNSTDYKLSLTGGGGITVNRIIPEAIALQVVRLLMGDQTAPDLMPKPGEPPTTGTSSLNLGTPKQFYGAKRPTTDIERVTVLAYYLTYARDKAHFKTIDLTKLNTEAAAPRLSNAAYAARNAVNNGFLALAGKGQKQISPLGEAVVKALPNHDAVKAAIAEAPKRKRRAKPKRSKK